MSNQESESEFSLQDEQHEQAHEDGHEHDYDLKIDPEENRFPYCIVWGPLPLITWLLPFVGHMGICDSRGRIFDFQGPYSIACDRFMVGDVAKYYPIPQSVNITFPAGCSTRQAAWDSAVVHTGRQFMKQDYSFCGNNCHHHTAATLRNLGIGGESVGLLYVWFLITFKGKYVSWGQVFRIYIPFLIFVGLILGLTLGLKHR